jgi:hypothetical protein
MYRIVITKDWTARLKLDRDVLAETATDTPESLAILRRTAEHLAGEELDWKGGTVRSLQPYHGQTVWWQAPAPVAAAA